MRDCEHRRAIGRVFRDLTLSLVGLLELYDVDPEVARSVAEVLRGLFRVHVGPRAGRTRRRGRAALAALLEEIDAAA